MNKKKDFAAAQSRIGGILAQAVSSAASPQIRTYLLLCATACPRGNSAGADEIRHGILNIMRNHGIKEGHRPGTEMILGFASRYACLGDLDKWAASRLQVACK